MNRIRFSALTALSLALAAGTLAMPAAAQEIVAAPNGDADLLAAEMRVLAENPRDMRALLSAAAISTRLEDYSAATAFLARAEKVEPENPGIFAGRAAVLVRTEHPGEALRLFALAEQRGLPMGPYLADRGLAYDLMGAPHLAQRDYQAALRLGNDDETVRRYALSLGIVGKSEEAMRLLEPLLRRSDRAAWRARAFILAMNGDIAGADRIAQSMMPGNMGAGLSPFFRRLQGMGPGDRAFAVHYGQMGRTSARLADAQLAPPFQPYVPEPQRPVQVAAATPTPAPTSVGPAGVTRDRRSRRDRRENLAAPTQRSVAPQPTVVASVEPSLPPPPRYVEPQPEIVQPLPTPAHMPAPVRLAGAVERDTRVVTTGAPIRVASSTRVTAQARPVTIGAEDRGLAGIVGGIEVPASERTAMEELPSEDELAAQDPAPAPVRVAAAPARQAPKPEPKPADAKPKPGAGKTAAATPATDAKGKKKDAPKPKPKVEPEPARIWVQVAGGANEDVLPKTWSQLVKQAPAAFRGRTPWWVPVRATNRLLAGPFKTNAEAQAFVNTLKKEGISAFVFSSEAGQKISKLALK